jgi:hypothetical protein
MILMEFFSLFFATNLTKKNLKFCEYLFSFCNLLHTSTLPRHRAAPKEQFDEPPAAPVRPRRAGTTAIVRQGTEHVGVEAPRPKDGRPVHVEPRRRIVTYVKNPIFYVNKF